jgi:hypothetical protein
LSFETGLDIFWLKDKSLTDLDNLPEPETLAEDIIENLESGLASFRAVLPRCEIGSPAQSTSGDPSADDRLPNHKVALLGIKATFIRLRLIDKY